MKYAKQLTNLLDITWVENTAVYYTQLGLLLTIQVVLFTLSIADNIQYNV